MTVALRKRADELARALTLRQRIEFAERVMTGIDSFSSPEIEQAWSREVKRRLDDYRAGKVKAIPSAQVHAELKRRLNEIKACRISSRSAA
jgi:putative addiction module component (TIGR02574 family)